MVVLYGVATGYLAFVTQRMIDRSILLHTKNEKLLTALRRKVDTAHTAEQRFRALVESSLDVTLIFSPEGRVVYASPSAEKAFGIPAYMLLCSTGIHYLHEYKVSALQEGAKSKSAVFTNLEIRKFPKI